MIAAKPMVQHVYERAAAVPGIDRVLVATDSERIRRAVQGFGGDVVMTRPTHTSGTDRIAEVAATLDAEIVVNIQGDLPFLEPVLVTAGLEALESCRDASMSTIMTPIRDAAEWRRPHVVKVVTDGDGYALYFSRSPIPFHRDGAPPALWGYRHIGLYVFRRDFLLRFAAMAPTRLEKAEKLEQLRALEAGYRIKVAAVEAAPIEIDTPEDLEEARGILSAEGVGDGKAQ